VSCWLPPLAPGFFPGERIIAALLWFTAPDLKSVELKFCCSFFDVFGFLLFGGGGLLIAAGCLTDWYLPEPL